MGNNGGLDWRERQERYDDRKSTRKRILLEITSQGSHHGNLGIKERITYTKGRFQLVLNFSGQINSQRALADRVIEVEQLELMDLAEVKNSAIRCVCSNDPYCLRTINLVTSPSIDISACQSR
jgi:hypothetical protein